MCQYTVVFGYNTVCASVCSLMGMKNEAFENSLTRRTAHKSHLMHICVAFLFFLFIKK